MYVNKNSNSNFEIENNTSSDKSMSTINVRKKKPIIKCFQSIQGMYTKNKGAKRFYVGHGNPRF